MTIKNISFFKTLISFCLISITVLAYFVYSNFYKIQRVKQAELYYSIYHDFFFKTPVNQMLIRDLGDTIPLLKTNGGRFDLYNFDDYLGYFELLKNYMDEGIAPEKSIYDTYSYYIIQAYQNKEIWGYVTDLRKQTNDTTYYKGTETLAKRFMSVNKSEFDSH